MTDITPSSARIQEEAEDFRSPVSEASMFAIGGAINECLDRTDLQATQITALQAQDAVFAPKIYQRGEFGTSYNYTLSDPMPETLLATATITARYNPSANVLVALNLKYNEAYMNASYSVNVSGLGLSITTTWRITRSINGGAETNVVSGSKSQNFPAGPQVYSGVFLGAWNGLNKNIETDLVSLPSADATLTYRVYVDYDQTAGASLATSFSATGLVFQAIQLR